MALKYIINDLNQFGHLNFYGRLLKFLPMANDVMPNKKNLYS